MSLLILTVQLLTCQKKTRKRRPTSNKKKPFSLFTLQSVEPYLEKMQYIFFKNKLQNNNNKSKKKNNNNEMKTKAPQNLTTQSDSTFLIISFCIMLISRVETKLKVIFILGSHEVSYFEEAKRLMSCHLCSTGQFS